MSSTSAVSRSWRMIARRPCRVRRLAGDAPAGQAAARAARRRRPCHDRHAAAEADRADVGLHRDRAVAALDDDPAGSRGDVTQIFVKSGDRSALGTPLVQIDPDKQQATVRSTEANARRRARRTSTYWQAAGRAAEVAARRRARSASRSSSRRRTRSTAPRRSSPRSTRRSARTRSSSSTTASPRRTAGVVGDIPIREGDRVTDVDR